MRIRLFLFACALTTGLIVPTLAQYAAPTTPPAPGAGPGMGMMTPEMRQQMMSHMQEMVIMMQNNAVETTDGIVVLQGNRLLQFDNKSLKLKRTLALPLPTMTAAMPPMMGDATTPMATPTPMPGMIPTRLLSIGNGEVVVVRGQQMIRVGKNMTVLENGIIPDMPPLTPDEMSAVSPSAMYMMAMMGMMGMGTTGVAAGMPTQPMQPTAVEEPAAK